MDPETQSTTLQLTPDPQVPLIFLNIIKSQKSSFEDGKRSAVTLTKALRDSHIAEKNVSKISEVLQAERADSLDVFLDSEPKRDDYLPLREGFIVGKPGSQVPGIFPYIMQLPKKGAPNYPSVERSFEEVVHSVRLAR